MILLVKQQIIGEVTLSSGPVDEAGNYTRVSCWGLFYNETEALQVVWAKKHMTIENLFLATEPSEINDKLAELELEPPEGWEY